MSDFSACPPKNIFFYNYLRRKSQIWFLPFDPSIYFSTLRLSLAEGRTHSSVTTEESGPVSRDSVAWGASRAAGEPQPAQAASDVSERKQINKFLMKTG